MTLCKLKCGFFCRHWIGRSIFHRVIPQDGAERRNQEEERKKYHNKQV